MYEPIEDRSELRTGMISIRLNDREKAMLKELAEEDGRTVSRYLLHLAELEYKKKKGSQ